MHCNVALNQKRIKRMHRGSEQPLMNPSLQIFFTVIPQVDLLTSLFIGQFKIFGFFTQRKCTFFSCEYSQNLNNYLILSFSVSICKRAVTLCSNLSSGNMKYWKQNACLGVRVCPNKVRPGKKDQHGSVLQKDCFGCINKLYSL